MKALERLGRRYVWQRLGDVAQRLVADPGVVLVDRMRLTNPIWPQASDFAQLGG